jgi:O-antigen/teichoic acid export membrane protein
MNGWPRERALFHLRRLSVNTALQIGSQTLPLVAGAAAFPIIYRNISHADFGIFTVGLSILGLLSLLDLGLGRATVRFMARAFAEGNLPSAASVAVHSAMLLGGFSLVICAASLAFVPAIAAHLTQPDTGQPQIVRQSLYILIATLPFAGLTAVLRSVLEARENFPAISAIQTVLGILTYVAPLALSFVTADVRVLIAGAVAGRILTFLAFLVAARRAWQGSFPWRSVDVRAEREFRQFSLWLVVSNVVGSCVLYGDRALLMRLFRLEDIAFYNVPLEMLGRTMLIVNSAATVLFPMLSRFAGNKVLFDRVYVALTTLLAAAVGVALLGLSLLAPAGLEVWLGEEFRGHSTGIVRILLVGLLFQSLIPGALLSLNARGFSRPIALMQLVETPIYFGALYWCGLRLGLTGVALAWSGRVLAEYVCFVGFQMSVGSRDAVRRQAVGAALAASNAIPAAVVAFRDDTVVALVVSGVCALACVTWALSELRAAQAHVRGRG